MSGFPNDILEAASEASQWAEGLYVDGLTDSEKEEVVQAIADKILAERRRCAVIARNWQPSQYQDEHYAANTIADRIMSDSRGGE